MTQWVTFKMVEAIRSEGHPFLPGCRELSNKADRHVGVDLNVRNFMDFFKDPVGL